LVEQRIENPRVGGSNPSPGTILSFILLFYQRVKDVSLCCIPPITPLCEAGRQIKALGMITFHSTQKISFENSVYVRTPSAAFRDLLPFCRSTP
jgi:hypothetical protein